MFLFNFFLLFFSFIFVETFFSLFFGDTSIKEGKHATSNFCQASGQRDLFSKHAKIGDLFYKFGHLGTDLKIETFLKCQDGNVFGSKDQIKQQSKKT